MKLKFTLLLVALTNFIFANSFTDYKTRIAKDRFILIFEKNVTAEQKAAIINQSNFANSFTHIPAPTLTICFTNDVDSATKYFSSVPEIKFVSFFITDQKHFGGVLDNFFVKLKDKNFEPLLRQKLQQQHLGEAVPDKYIPNLFRVQNFKTLHTNTVDLCAIFMKEGWCEYASPNYLLTPEVCSNDPYYNRQWNIQNTGTFVQGSGTIDADMDVDSAWTLTTGNPNIKIGIIDSGVDTLHPDLAVNMLPGHDAINDSTDGYPTPAHPEDGHGTCCAGIVAAVMGNSLGVAGVAPSCKIIPVRTFYYLVLGSTVLPFSTADAFANAIGWAAAAGADILSNSWGLPEQYIISLPGGTQPVEDAIQQAYTTGRGGKGLAMFFSSGNEEDSTGSIWPGKLPQTIAVNATSMCDERKNATDCSSETWSGNWGVNIDFSAPGVKISTTDMQGNKGFNTGAGTSGNYYVSFNGTSAACPNAAAVGALLLSILPNWSAEDIRNIIARSCDKVGGYGYDSLYYNGTWSRELGYGRVNAYNALLYSLSYVPSAITNAEQAAVFNIYPNPNNGNMKVLLSSERAVMKIYNLTGEEMMSTEITQGINQVSTDLLSAGVYIAKLDTGTNMVTRKVAIIK